LTDRFSEVASPSDFQRVFLGVLESTSIRSVRSGMLREIGGRKPVARLGLLVVLKVDSELEKRRKYGNRQMPA
jgi:hypothetical protein